VTTAAVTASQPTGEVIRVPRPDSLPPPEAGLVVVEASAGTGKTYFLEHRVVDLVLAGAELEQILLVTFTEKAVAELRLRIRDLLDRLSRVGTSSSGGSSCWEIDDTARRRLRAAVTAFDHAPIHTIHGFCHRVLIDDAFAAQRMFSQTQVADEVAFDTAFGALLRERFARVSPDRELLGAFLETGKTVDRLRDVLLDCARKGRDARIRRRLDPETVQAAVAGLRARFGTQGRRDVVEVAIGERRWVPDWLADIGRALDHTPETTEPPRLVAMIDSIREPIEYLLKRSQRLPPDALAALRAASGTITLAEAVAAQLLPPLIARIADDKDERGLFDYDDMLQLVWRALCGPRRDALAARLRERTPWVMIDEFQDTDPVQWNIFRTVWMHPAAKGLTIVGDPKQAIYSFRGADVQTYIAAREEMLRAGATRVALTVNRRSTPQLVEAVNQILVGNMLGPMLDKSIRYDEPVRASGDVASPDVRPPITVFQLHCPVRPPIEHVRAALADAIGDAIDELRRNVPAWTVDTVAQPFALGQVMVLTRTNRDSTEIAASLRARGLACALVEPERLFETREASELSCVLAAIAAPRDRGARLRALRTRFFDVPWSELHQVVDAPDHHPQIARIFDWAQLAARRAYESLFRRLVDDSRYTERALVLGGGERALTNTWHLIELLLAEVARSRCDLHELVIQLRRWITDRAGHPDERDVQRAETDGDAIRVLTVHKAKGLEAAYVFMYGGTSGGPKSGVHRLAGSRPGGDAGDRGVTLILGTPDDDTQRLLDDEVTAENQRLAYVALTRARVRLYLPLYATEGALQKNAAYHPIQRCLAPFVGPRAPAARALFELMSLEVGAAAQAPAPSDALAGFSAPPAPPIHVLSELAPSRRGLTMVSYTRLAHDIDIATVPVIGDAVEPGTGGGEPGTGGNVEIDPAEFDVDDAGAASPAASSLAADAQIVVGPGELPPGASSGLLLHDVLEVADLEVARRAADATAWSFEPDVARSLVEAACARGVAPRFLPHAAKLAHGMLTAPLALVDGTQLPPLVDATAVAREVEFSYPIPTLGAVARRGLVRGYIDALVAYDDELWVLDYKSDALAGADLPAAALHRVRQHYEIQARLYAIAADRLRGRRKLAGMLFAFLRYGIVVPMRAGEQRLDAWTDWLARIAAHAANRTGREVHV
jgi:exodeoxyribonuclease V beta subunit